MKTHLHLPFLFFIVVCWQCQQPKSSELADSPPTESGNPAAEGFDEAGSDQKAIALADEVMDAMGGRKLWDDTRFFSWNFFGARKLYWDKGTGDVRVEYLREDMQAIVNIHSMEGKVMQNGSLVEHPDSLAKYLKRAKSVWINDAYWVFMPFKLKDSGVTLTHVGAMNDEAGHPAQVVEMKFKDVGDTPDNRYQVWIDDSSKLVCQWAWYRESDQEEPNFITPWASYQDYDGLKLSGDRGRRQITEIAVPASFPENLFVDFSVKAL